LLKIESAISDFTVESTGTIAISEIDAILLHREQAEFN
jgi:hypothetical protein